MSTALRSFYHNLKEPVVICEFSSNNSIENLQGVYFNKAFKRVFSCPSDTVSPSFLKKLDYKFHFDFCLLESENLKTYSPFKNAIEAHENFTVYGAYQKSEREVLYFLIQAFCLKKYRILYFYDVTKEIMLNRLAAENERLKLENRDFLDTNFKAQNQAVKMALLNRVSVNMSKTIDINDLINTALRELGIIFGAKKAYFAKRCGNQSGEEFLTEYAYPDGEKTGKILIYDKQTTDDILDNKISAQVCLLESENDENPMICPQTRIILPITNKDSLIGIVVILTGKKNIEPAEYEFLSGVQKQISSELIQGMLFDEVSKKKEELEGALSELKETQLQLINSEKMASLGHLVASVAHEINTPLASICANNEIAKKFFEKNKTFDEDIVEILADTNSIDADAIKRITNIVKSLKRFVRLDEETGQEANINEELDLTLHLLHHKLKKNIKLTKNYGSLPLVQCYPNMLNQVFLNILTNAIQSIEKESQTANSPYNGEITVTTEIADTVLVIKIQDNGAGIKEEDKKKIFQAGFTTKKVGEGTGLGLAICKKIMDKHKGEISFESTQNEAGKRTVFTLKIPIINS